MVQWAGDRLKKLGAEVEYASVGMQVDSITVFDEIDFD